MALETFKRLFYKFILTALFLTLTWVTVIGIAVEDTLSMEQQVRCGLTEHTHTDGCYLDGLLLCKKRHIPTRRTVILFCCRTMTLTDYCAPLSIARTRVSKGC